MSFETSVMECAENASIHVMKWTMDETSEIRAILQIAHGMAEHAERYDHFASFMRDNGILCYANDHRGHGKTASTIQDIGFFADNNGWQLVVQDMVALTREIKKEHPGIPVIIMGHSMGSFLLRNYLYLFGNEINGAILSGTSGNPGLLGVIGKWVAKIEGMVRGKKNPSHLMNFLSFSSFNKQFKPNRTEFDWLSRDDSSVDQYIKDPLCGGVFSISFFNDLLQGILDINKQENIEKMPKDLPVFFFSGDNDPVGNNGKGVLEIYNTFKSSGMADVSIKLYEDARHETLNEINKDDVYADILYWLNQHIS